MGAKEGRRRVDCHCRLLSVKEGAWSGKRGENRRRVRPQRRRVRESEVIRKVGSCK